MPQSSYRKGFRSPTPPETARVIKEKRITSTLSREFTAYERYYGIENSPDHAFRKEHYIVDEFIYKSRTDNSKQASRQNSAQYGSRHNTRSKPIACAINKYLPENIQSRKSFGPMKNVDSELPGNDLEDKNIDPTNVPMDWNNYHRLPVIHKFMDNLENEFPSLCTTGVIGKSLENRDLKILKISNSDASNSRIWIDSGIHAREWIAPAVSTFVANHIARHFDSMPNSVRRRDWYFMPVLNPDGYEYTHTTNRMWRKNKAHIRHTLFGVDLNRNFSFGWGGKGSSDEPNNSFYRGPRPFSEPETSAMRDIFLNSGVNFQVYITLHSFGQVIIMPFAYREELASDYIRLLEGATVMSKAIYDTNGNTYKVGISKDVMYQASGTSNDWSHGEVGIPFCYLIELRSKKHKFRVPKEEIKETGEEILNCVTALVEFIDNYKPPAIEKTLNQRINSEESYTTSEKSMDSKVEKISKETEGSVVFRLNSADYEKTSQTEDAFDLLCHESEVQVSYRSAAAVSMHHPIAVQVSNHSGVSYGD